MKKIFALLAVFTLMFSVTACSSDKEDKNENTTEKKEDKSALTDQVKSKIYNSVRIAEGKVNTVFHHDFAADETTPILNPSFADEAAVVAFLSKYYSEDKAKEIYSYYATGEKTAEGQAIVKTEPFFTPSLLETKLSDVKVEGDANKAVLTQTDGFVYTVELKDNQYVVTETSK